MQYKLIGTTMPAVEITFDQPGEKMITQSGGMAWMSADVSMDTNTNGGIKKGLGRLLAGESMFQANYTAQRAGASIAFASTVAGQIMPIDVSKGAFIIQKGAFLCSEAGVNLDIVVQKKLGAGFFGGEGFVLQKISGSGICFLEVDGDKVVKTLAPGEVLLVDTGNVVAFQEGVGFDIETVKGAKNILLGGEGLFLTKLTGPGEVVLQTQNLNEFAQRIAALIPSSSS